MKRENINENPYVKKELKGVEAEKEKNRLWKKGYVFYLVHLVNYGCVNTSH